MIRAPFRRMLTVLLAGCFVAAALPPSAISASCPPGWESCTSPSPNGECCAPLGTLWRTLAQTCTVWDHDVNAYPHCTYKVVERYVVKSCDWWDAC